MTDPTPEDRAEMLLGRLGAFPKMPWHVAPTHPYIRAVSDEIRDAEATARKKALEEAARLCDDEADTWEQYGLTEKVMQAEACANRIRVRAKEAPSNG